MSKLLAFLTLLCLSFIASAKQVTIAINSPMPPYVFEQQISGLEIAIINAAFHTQGYRTSFKLSNTLALSSELSSGAVDGVAQNKQSSLIESLAIDVYASRNTFFYHNYAITLGFKRITSLDELAGLKVVAFLGARTYLGQAFNDAIESNRFSYVELPNQAKHAQLLHAGEFDVVISDKRIFDYWQRKLNGHESSDTKYYKLFEKSARDVKFTNRTLRDEFNKGLAKIIANGSYKEILLEYDVI
ncbi:ABC transporter substrate-binding protein [Psychrobium sp. 1_MG-2023]|uniref:substrate-binding periplasmic protein n=1 Tax=Psychrobium sp. 1_MG-2023 TaxID=3062624 RepID=UPI0027340261|nr:transporter substrate-binding domain-containing protein [Psychrobium sp. 1_MG-2023]MDP2560513.1 transporter substrate-binding domain-containing protein [Psychrobium sp. 1_MG-2023]